MKVFLRSLFAVLLFVLPATLLAQTPVPMASQSGLTYTENFSDIANWTNNFAAGTGASRFKAVGANATGTIPDGMKTTYNTSTFAGTSSGGVQKGTLNMLFLATGTPDNGTAGAVDFLVDFTGVNAGTLSFDWAEVANSTGNRVNTLQVYTSTDGTAFTALSGTTITATNNISASGTITSIQLPASFNGLATAYIRFYISNGTGGSTGSRPKISIDNLTVTATANGSDVTPPVNTATYPTTANLGATSVDVVSNLNEAGTTYYVLSPAATTAPSIAQIMGGLDGTGAAALKSGSFAVTASTNASATISGLTSATAYNVYVVSKDGSGNVQAASTTINITTLSSSNNNLSALTLSGGFTLNETFAANTTSYTATVPNGTASITVTPTVADATATIKVNTVAVTSGSPSGSIALATGTNTITTVVTAQDLTTKTYTLTVTVLGASPPAIVSSSPTLSAMAGNYGTPSTPAGTFNVSGSNMTAGVLVTPPTGFEVSTDNSTFAATVTVGTAGTITTLPVYVRLKATTAVGTYSGNVALTSSGATEVDVAIAASTVTAVAPTATTTAATAITQTSATLNGTLTDGGAIATATFEYSTISANVSGGTGTSVVATPATVAAGAGSTAVSAALTGLTPATTYYYWVKGTNPAAGTGTVLNFTTGATSPGVQASNVAASGTTPSGTTISWTNGDGTSRAVFVKATAVAGTPTPVDGTAYTANAAFAAGTQITTTGWYCVYNGTGTSVTVSGLATGTAYMVMVDEYNGTGTGSKYLTTGTAVALTTLAPTPVTLTTSPYTENFDNIGTAMPNGFTVVTGASASLAGTPSPLSPVQILWNNATGAFKNVASNDGGLIQTSAQTGTNRALGLRQTGSVGDPGGSFVFQVANTTGKKNLKLSFSLESLDNTSARNTPWTVEYALPSAPTTFIPATATGTNTTGNSIFGLNVINADFGTALDDLSGVVTIRITALTASTGGGNRATSAIDNFSLSWITAPTVTTTAASAITTTSATLAGNVTSDGGSTVTERGIVYNTTGSPTTADTKVSIGTGTGTFSQSVTGLASGTTYYINSYAINAAGTSYGTATSFATTAVVTPTISTTGTLSALSTTYGTASTSGTFNVSGANMTAGILVTPPAGFEVSTDNATFAGTVTVGAAGTIASTPVYIRLKTTTVVGSAYSGNVVLTSAGATTANVATATSAVTAAPLTITANLANKTYGTALTTAAGLTAFTPTGLKNSETITSVTLTYGTGATATSAVGTYTGSVVPSLALGTFTASNYSITYTAGDIVIAAAPLTITASAKSKVYGTSPPSGSALTGFTSSALQNGETINSLVLTYGTGGSTSSAVGSYTQQITPSFPVGITASNYSITYVKGDITVTAAPLTITANNVDKVVGTTITGGTGSTAFTTSTMPNGESVGTVTITYGAGSASGAPINTYTGSVVASAATGGSFTASNYSITYAAGDINVIAAPTPTISTTGTLSALSTTFGTASSSGTFSVSGANMNAGITVVAPTGFEVSTDNSTFTSSVTVGAAGTIASTPVYVRLLSTDAAGSYSGNVALSSTSATTVNVPTVSSTVNAAAITITAGTANKTYGGSLTGTAGSTAYTLTSGTLKNGNTLTSVTVAYGTGAAVTDAAATYTAQVTPSAAVGANGFLASNYSITYAKGDIVVAKAALSITANNVNKTFGATLTGGTGSTAFTTSALQNSETVGSVTITYGAGAAATDAINTYTGSVVASAATTGSFTASNYTITYVAGNITVSAPATPTITASGSLTPFKTCLGSASGAQSFTISGNNLTTDITVTAPAGYELSLSSGGTYGSALTLTQVGGVVSSTTIFARLASSASGNPAGNITSTSAGAATQNIAVTSAIDGLPTVAIGTVAAVTTASTTFTIPYTGAANSPDKYSISTGATAMPSFVAVTNASLTGSPITVTIPASAANTYNFKLTVINSVTGCVSASLPFNLTVNAPTPTINTTGTLSALTSSYGSASSSGSFNVSGTNMSAGILVSPPTAFEVSTDNTTFTGTVTVGAAGTIASTPVYIRLKSTDAATSYSGNVALTSASATTVNVATTSSTVSPRAVTITPKPVNKPYGQTLSTGTALPVDLSVSGMQNGETITSTTISYGTGGVINAPVGTYVGTTVASSAVGSSGFVASNYTITYAFGDLFISAVPLTITAADVPKPYGATLISGAGAPAFIPAGLVNGETIASVTLTYGTGAAGNAAVGTYTNQVTPSAATGGSFTASNYTITYTPGTIVVGKAPLVIAASNAPKSYGTALAGGAGSTAFTPIGLANGETIGSVTIAYGTGAPANAAVATYTGQVTPSAATGGTFTASNYAILYSPGDIVVSKAALTITANNVPKIYGATLTGAAGSTAFTSAGLVNGESIASVTIAYGTGAAAAATAATYTGQVTPSAATGGTFTASNYTITYVSGDIVVSKLILNITANNVPKTYGATLAGAAGSAAFTATGLVNGETIGSVTIAYGTGSAAGAAVNTYTGQVTPSAATGGTFIANNYTITYTAGDITVGKAALTATANAQSISYGAAIPTLGITYTGFVNSETAAALTTAPVAATAATSTSAVGTYP